MAAASRSKALVEGVTTFEGWSKLGVHRVTLPSGAVVKIRIPDLSMLLANDAVPEELRTAAIEEINNAYRAASASASGAEYAMPEISVERMRDLAGLNRYLVSESLVDPPLSDEQLASGQIPDEDILMLSQFASRERVYDAKGVKLGIEPIDRYQEWVDAHGCADDCKHCAEAIRALSTLP
jgi:hypothetical protein